MDDLSSGISLVVILLVANAFITLCHAALINVRRSNLMELADEGDKRALAVIQLVDGKARLYITYKFAVILVRFLTAAAVTLWLVLPLVAMGSHVLGLLILLGTGMASLILGDLVPESVATIYADRLALRLVGVMRTLMLILWPVVAFVLALSRLISSLFGSAQVINTVTEEEIMTLVSAGHSDGTIEEEEKEMIYSVLQLDERTARELMTPRMDIVAIDINATVIDALRAFTKSGFSRIPVYEDNVDNISGLLYAKDLLTLWESGVLDNREVGIRDLVRPAFFVPETKHADELLKELQNRNIHMAIVVDEYGGTAGLVTIENLIEEIVGDIRDEHDVNEEADFILTDSGDYIIDATMNLDDVNELLDIELESEDADTVGGYIFAAIGRVPIVGDEVETDEVRLRVAEIEGRRIRKIVATLKKDATNEIETKTDLSDNSSSASASPRQLTDSV